jgi:nucleotide-binding universal stress UspA family protein
LQSHRRYPDPASGIPQRASCQFTDWPASPIWNNAWQKTALLKKGDAMSAEKFEQVIRAYIDRSRELAALPQGDPRHDEVRAEFDTVGLALEDELEVYVDRCSRQESARTILVAVDKSEQADWALAEAVRLAEGTNARISLVHVIDATVLPTVDLAFDDERRLQDMAVRAKTLLNTLTTRVPLDLRDQLLVREGKADKEIVEAARHIGADLIVIGTHGRGAIGRLLLGSVAESVLRNAPCPVVTVGHPRQVSAPDPYAIAVPESVAEKV